MADAQIIRGNKNTTRLINQLKNSSKQYPCLDKDQERELIEKYRNDRETLNQKLFMHNIRTVFNLAKSYMRWTNDYDSLVQNGMVGLGVAVQRFDIDRNIKFCTYATLWVRKYMTLYFHSTQFTKIDARTTSINTPSMMVSAGDDVSCDDTFENCIHKYMDPAVVQPVKTVETEISAIEQSDICKKLYEYMEKDTSLSATDKAVFTRIFVDHEKTRDIAMEYKLEPSAISEIKNRILGKFRELLRYDYNIESYSDLAY